MSCGCINFDCSHRVAVTTSSSTTTTLCPDAITNDSVYPGECVVYTGADSECFTISSGDNIFAVLYNLLLLFDASCTTTTTTTLIPITTTSTTTTTTRPPRTTTTTSTTLRPTTTSTTSTTSTSTTSTTTVDPALVNTTVYLVCCKGYPFANSVPAIVLPYTLPTSITIAPNNIYYETDGLTVNTTWVAGLLSDIQGLGYPGATVTYQPNFNNFTLLVNNTVTGIPFINAIATCATVRNQSGFLPLLCPEVNPNLSTSTTTVNPDLTTSTTSTSTTTQAPTTSTTSTTTTKEPIFLRTCAPLYNDDNGNIYSYEVDTNTSQLVFTSGYSYLDIAHSVEKLWLSTPASIVEYDITLSPFTITPGKTIPLPLGYVQSLGLTYRKTIDNSIVISINERTNPGVVNEINTLTGVVTPQFNLISGRKVSGDFILTDSNYKFIVTSQITFGGTFPQTFYFISQYDYYTGALEVDIDITATINKAWGIFEDGGEIFIMSNDGGVYTIGKDFPYAITFVSNTGNTLRGASQPNECLLEEFSITSTTTSTTTTLVPITTSTSTSTTTSTTTTSSTSTTTTTDFPPSPARCVNTNVGFNTDLSGWEVSKFAPPDEMPTNDWIWDNGRAAYNGGTTGGYIAQDVLTVGFTYRITLDLTIINSGFLFNKSIRVYAGTTASAIINTIGLTAVDVTLTCATNGYLAIYGIDSIDGAGTPYYMFIDNVCAEQTIPPPTTTTSTSTTSTTTLAPTTTSTTSTTTTLTPTTSTTTSTTTLAPTTTTTSTSTTTTTTLEPTTTTTTTILLDCVILGILGDTTTTTTTLVPTTTTTTSTTSTTTTTEAPLAWRAATLACETDTQFAIIKQITGISTPENVWYDESLNRVWVADGDNFIKGNVYWFNPATATTEADVTYYTGIKANSLYTSYIDTVYRRIYFFGTDTDNLNNPNGSGVITGLVVYSMDSNTHIQIPYGSNQAFKRMINFVTTNYIYGNDFNTASFVRFDRATPLNTPLNKTYAATGVAAYFTRGAQQMIEVGDKIWVAAGPGGNNTLGSIGIFDTDLNFIRSITLPGVAIVPSTRNGSNYYWQTGFFDADNNLFYVTDFGSNNYYVIAVNGTYDNGTVTTRSLTYLLENKAMHSAQFSIDPIVGKLYISISIFDQIGVSPIIPKSYEIDRTTGAFKILLNRIGIGNLVSVNDGVNTNSVMGVFGGNVGWGNAYPSTAFSDGTVTIYNNSVFGDNTGIVDVLTLSQYNVNTGLPTGVTKDNVYGEPDYIPPYLDLTECPITYSLQCADLTYRSVGDTKVYYEFGIINTVKLNPAISKIKVSVFTTLGNVFTTSLDINAPFISNYYSGDFTVALDTYYVTVTYYDASNVLLACDTTTTTTSTTSTTTTTTLVPTTTTTTSTTSTTSTTTTTTVQDFVVCPDCIPILSNVTANGIGLLSVGNMTSATCALGDYVIDWYVDSILNPIEFTSGNTGNTDLAIQQFHPFTGASARPSIGGSWIPVIRYAYLDSIKYTSQITPGAAYASDLATCLAPITVLDLNCENGTNTTVGFTQYSHKFAYTNGSQVASDASKSLVFTLNSDASTQYFAWYFQGVIVSDRIKFTYVSPGNSTSTLLQDFVVGTDLPATDFTGLTKKVDEDNFRYIIDLTTTTYTAGDYILIDIIAGYIAPNNSNTNWIAYFKCLTTFDTSWTAASRIPCSASMTYNPATCWNTLSLTLSNYVDKSPTDIWKYLSGPARQAGVGGPSTVTPVATDRLSYGRYYCNYDASSINYNPACVPATGTITHSAVNNVNTLVYSNIAEYNKALTFYNAAQASLSATYTSDPTNINHYKFYEFFFTKYNNDNCGDTRAFGREFTVHYNSTVTFDLPTLTLTVTAVPIDASAYFATLPVGDCKGNCDSLVLVTNANYAANRVGTLAPVTTGTDVVYPVSGFGYTQTAPNVDVSQMYYMNQYYLPYYPVTPIPLANNWASEVTSGTTRIAKYMDYRVYTTITDITNPTQNFYMQDYFAPYTKIYEISGGVVTTPSGGCP